MTRFSARTRWDLTPNRLSGVIAARRSTGLPLLDLTESNPTRAGIPYPDDLLLPLGDASSLRYEPEPRGLPETRAAVARTYAARGTHGISTERLVLTASTSEAYAFLFKLLCDPGDSVLVPQPSYPLFGYLAGLESVAVRGYPLVYEGAWHVDLAAVEAGLRQGARAVVVVHPNNPTGSWLHRDEIATLRRLAAAHGAAVVADEVFLDYSFVPGRSACSFAAPGEGLAFALGGLSKSCGLPQLKLGWIAVSGDAATAAETMARLEIVADTYLSVSTPVQRAAPALLGRLRELQAPIAARVRANRARVLRLTQGTAATLLHADAGWYAVLHVPATLPEEEWVARLVERDGVLVHPGFFFDFAREAYLVLSLLPREADLETGVRLVLDRVAAPDGPAR